MHIQITYLFTIYLLDCISLQYSEQTVSEDEGQIFLRACFEKPPTNDLIILFNSRNGTAFGELPDMYLCTVLHYNG